MSKTRRKAYTGSKAVDKSCRGKRGSCPTCSENRQYKNTKREVNEPNNQRKKYTTSITRSYGRTPIHHL